MAPLSVILSRAVHNFFENIFPFLATSSKSNINADVFAIQTAHGLVFQCQTRGPPAGGTSAHYPGTSQGILGSQKVSPSDLPQFFAWTSAPIPSALLGGLYGVLCIYIYRVIHLIYIYIYIYIYICVYIYIYMYRVIHKNIYICIYTYLFVYLGILGTFGRVAPSNPGELFQHFHAALVFLCASVSYIYIYIYIKSSYIFSLSLWATNMHEVHRSSMHTSGHPALSLPPEVCTISFSATCPPEKRHRIKSRRA